MDTAYATTDLIQIQFGQSQCNSNGLFVRSLVAVAVLQPFPGRITGLCDFVKEGGEIFLFQCFYFCIHTFVFFKEVECTQNRTVTGEFTNSFYILNHIIFLALFQNFFSEVFCYFFHFIRNCRILCTQICMTFSGVDDNQIMAHLIKIAFDLTDGRIFDICKVDGDHTANGTCQLIQKTGTFQPVFIFCILSCFCISDNVDLSFVKQVIYDNTYQHLKRCGRAYPCPTDYVGSYISVKSFYFASFFQQSCKDSF